jgi:hypothetical protein
VKEKLDVWPGLPIVVSGYCDTITCVRNIKAALEHSDRICQIELMVNAHKVPAEGVFTALEKPFPVLTDLDLSQWPSVSIFEFGYPDPLKFLGSSIHLRSLSLGGIAIPQFPALIASFVDLNKLRLHDIPYGYLKPDAMATALSALTSLETLSLGFASGQRCADLGNQASQHPLPRSVIRSLFCFDFEGVSQYLEALVARIDTPVLDRLGITLFHQPTFDTTQLRWFLSRIPNMQEFDKARVKLASPNPEVWTDFSSTSDFGALRVGILSSEPERRFQCLARFFGLPFNPTPESLYIAGGPYLGEYPWVRVENSQWLELLRPFVAVKNLHISKEVAARIAPALEELVGERATEVFPTLQKVFLEGEEENLPTHSAIMKFATVRRLSGHPIHIVSQSRDDD